MSVSAYSLLTHGTPLAWKASGGDYAITLTSLANAAARQGEKGDLGAFWRRRWRVILKWACNAAATAGTLIEVYSAQSPSATAGTDNPGGANGTDASFGTPGEYKFQLTRIGSLYLSNNAGTGVQEQHFDFFPSERYQCPVVVNSSGQAGSGTAGNFELRFIPLDDVLATTSGG